MADRVSQQPVEVVVLPTDANVRLSQQPVEVVVLPTDANVRVSQLVVEVVMVVGAAQPYWIGGIY
jgi:hypothetical protein